MVLIKEIEFELSNKNINIPEAVEDTLIKDSVIDLANTDFSKVDDLEDVTAGAIRKQIDIDPGYSGKPISRKSYCRNDFKGEIFRDSNIFEHKDDESDFSSERSTEKNQLIDESDDECESSSNLSDSGSKEGTESDFSESRTSDDEDEDGLSIAGQTSAKTEETLNIFSVKSKDVDAEIAKGISVKNQLSIWENLVEGRIKLQNSLISANKLYQLDDYVNFKSSLKNEDEGVLTNTCKSLGSLMKTLLELQEELLNSSVDYINESSSGCYNSAKVDGTISDGENESISSSIASGFNEDEENDEEKSNNKKLINNDRIDDEPKIKKKKLNSNTDHLEEIYSNFKPYRDRVIQMWNDRTRVTSGKISNSDFSAFDQPTLKQIEQILLDKTRLLRKTQLKRSGYEILGKRQTRGDAEMNDSNNDEKFEKEYDCEIYDDDDFYHKLLRDFIERKATDVTDVKSHNKQWLDIQQLRSKMKRKVDTRCTKGRKLRYTVHNKLVNFMAPIPCNSWSEAAETQLFNSLFGKANELKS